MKKKLSSFLNDFFNFFRSLFKSKCSLAAFAAAVLGLLALSEKDGSIAGIVRALALDPDYYNSLLYFFREGVWSRKALRGRWSRYLKDRGRLIRHSGRIVILADGTLRATDGRFMPGVQKTSKKSGSASKSAQGAFYPAILGGGVAVVTENPDGTVARAVPVSCDVHSPDDPNVLYLEAEADAHYLRLMKDAVGVAVEMGADAYIVMDALHFKQEVWKYLETARLLHPEIRLDALVRVGTAASVRLPGASKNVKVYSLFESMRGDFTDCEVDVYGGTETLSLLAVNAVWGKSVKKELRFVLSRRGNGQRCVFACSDLAIGKEEAVELYALREKIEDCFRTMKQTFNGLRGHFWTRSEERTDRFASNKKNNEARAAITDEGRRGDILETWEATQRFMQVFCVAVGLATLVSLEHSSKEGDFFPRVWKRTYTESVLSVKDVKLFFESNLVKIIGNSEEGTPLSLVRDNMVPDPSDPSVVTKNANRRESGKKGKSKAKKS